jgi:pyruvate/2-oxoglutarate/acetoin dehydrogenase E1 component
VLHDATTFCGPGAEIAARITEELFEELLAPVKRLGAAYTPAPYAPSGLPFLPTSADVVDAATRLMG